MGLIDNPFDPRQEPADLYRRVSQLNRTAALNNAAVDSSPGIAVRVPDGVNVNDGGSLKIGDMQAANEAGTGSLKAGTTELSKEGVGSGGAKFFSDGKIGRADGGELATKDGFAVDGNLVVIGTVDGRGGLYTPWEGTKATVESIMGGIKTTATNAASAASAAQSTANTANSKAGTAQSRADSAWNLANGRVTQAQYDTLNGWLKTVGTALDALDKQVGNYHAGKPALPPFYKG